MTRGSDGHADPVCATGGWRRTLDPKKARTVGALRLRVGSVRRSSRIGIGPRRRPQGRRQGRRVGERPGNRLRSGEGGRIDDRGNNNVTGAGTGTIGNRRKPDASRRATPSATPGVE